MLACIGPSVTVDLISHIFLYHLVHSVLHYLSGPSVDLPSECSTWALHERDLYAVCSQNYLLIKILFEPNKFLFIQQVRETCFLCSALANHKDMSGDVALLCLLHAACFAQPRRIKSSRWSIPLVWQQLFGKCIFLSAWNPGVVCQGGTVCHAQSLWREGNHFYMLTPASPASISWSLEITYVCTEYKSIRASGEKTGNIYLGKTILHVLM